MSLSLLSLAARPLASSLLTFDGCNFSEPPGEAAVLPPNSVSWQVFSNPLSVYIGGIAAVLLELGEPRVRTGVWEHSSFRTAPRERMRRTGAAAMVTVYAARSEFEALARRVNAIHARIAGATPSGETYRADDADLLRWVQATASFAFLAAYRAYVEPVPRAQRDLFYAEARQTAPLYGVTDAPVSEAELERLFASTRPQLEPSPIIDEFLAIMKRAAILPLPLRPLQHLVARAAVELLPRDLRRQIGLASAITVAERKLLRLLARTAGRIDLPSSPWTLAEQRLQAQQPAKMMDRDRSPN